VYEHDDGPSTGDRTIAGRVDTVTGASSGAPAAFGGPTMSRTTAKATLSHYRAALWGTDHQWKFGTEVERGEQRANLMIPTGQRFADRSGAPSEVIISAPSHTGGMFITAAAFASDAVTLGDRVTVTGGVRFDHHRAISQDLPALNALGEETSEIVPGLGTLYTCRRAVDRNRPEVGRQLTLSIAYVRKDGRDFIGWTDTGGRYRQDERTLSDDRSVPVLVLENRTSDRRFLLTNPDGYSLTYNGLVVVAEKRRSRGWQALASYTFSNAHGLQASSGATAAGTQASTVAPPPAPAGLTFGRDPNDLTNARGLLPNDRPHVVFSVPRFGRVEVMLDVLNALNDAAEESLVTDTLLTERAHNPNFGVPNAFVDPRRAMVGVRLTLGR
jgi:hypothetical protein